jgi:hypothetical protein
MLPQNLKKFFWDTPLESIDRRGNKEYVISRLLELGDEPAVRWLEEVYALDELRHTVKTSRLLSPKTKNYWSLKFHVV